VRQPNPLAHTGEEALSWWICTSTGEEGEIGQECLTRTARTVLGRVAHDEATAHHTHRLTVVVEGKETGEVGPWTIGDYPCTVAPTPHFSKGELNPLALRIEEAPTDLTGYAGASSKTRRSITASPPSLRTSSVSRPVVGGASSRSLIPATKGTKPDQLSQSVAH